MVQRRCRQSSGKRRSSHGHCCVDTVYLIQTPEHLSFHQQRRRLRCGSSTVPLEKVTNSPNELHKDCFRRRLNGRCKAVLTHQLTLNAIMEPFSPLRSDAETARTQHRVSVPVCHPSLSLFFTFAVFLNVTFFLNTRILEYVFLVCSITLGFTQNKPVDVRFSVSCVVREPLRQQVSGRKTKEKAGESGVAFRTTPL